MADHGSTRDKSDFYRRLVALGGHDIDRLSRRDREVVCAVATDLSSQGIREVLALA